MKKNLDMLTGLFGDQVKELSEEQTSEIGERLEQIVESRVDAKVRFQTEIVESDAKEKYDTLLNEATAKFEADTKSLEDDMVSKASEFKKTLEEANEAKVAALEEAQEKEIESFKQMVVEKLDKYLNLELSKKVPETFVESVAKVEVLEPIVEGFKKVMSDNYVKFDEENFGLIKDARSSLVKSHKENTSLVNENMELSSELQTLKRSVKISQVCEGLTDTQRERAEKLLESYDVDEIETRFEAIRDIVIESVEVPAASKVIKEETDVNGKEEELDGSDVETKDVADAEEDVMETDEDLQNEVVEEALNPMLADAEAATDDSRLIESWAQEFKRISS